jgi:hypothetical protein
MELIYHTFGGCGLGEGNAIAEDVCGVEPLALRLFAQWQFPIPKAVLGVP